MRLQALTLHASPWSSQSRAIKADHSADELIGLLDSIASEVGYCAAPDPFHAIWTLSVSGRPVSLLFPTFLPSALAVLHGSR